MNINFYQFICSQILLDSFELFLEDDLICVKCNGKTYKEPKFDSNSKFSQQDLNLLHKLSHVENESVFNLEKYPKDENTLKLWFLITHEKYFKEKIELDEHGRYSSESLIQDFHEILKVPIVDILVQRMNLSFNIIRDIKSKKNIFLTCDFDHLNIWDTWTLKDLIRELFYSFSKFRLKKIAYLTSSYFFSRYHNIFNGVLNDHAFRYSENVKNVGFFIPSRISEKFDTKVSYSQKLVTRFIKKLKENNVEIGLHTSYATLDFPDSIQQQKTDFFRIFKNQNIISNRHHYLRFHFPDYLLTLEKINVQYDFSIYFPDSLLFRCGITSPFQIWNFIENRPFEVTLVPTTLMDGTFSDYLKLDLKESIELSFKKIDVSIKYGLSIVLLWHNTSLFKFHRSGNYHPKLYKEILRHLELKELI